MPSTLDAVLLTESTDEDLAPGVYVARSGTPAYGLLKAMLAAQDAFFLGERVEIDQQRYLAVSVGYRPNLSSPLRIRMVTDADAYLPNQEEPRMVAARANELEFTRYRQEYADWELCWWREAIQNAVDAGATQVDCVVEQLADGQWRVSCQDNGAGMDESTLMNVFLVRGATSKKEQDLGGFGQAKKLLLYAWAYWEVQTGRMFVKGEHEMHYERPVERSPVRGTRISVLMPNDVHTSIEHAKAFVSKCYLPRIRFTMNGESFSTGKLAGGDLVQDVGWGGIYFAKGHKRQAEFPGNVLVRVPTRDGGGELWMFDMVGAVPAEIPGQLMMRIVGDPKQILTVSRQGFREWHKQSVVNAFLLELAADKRSALKKKDVKPPERLKFQGTGKFSAEITAELVEKKRHRTAAMMEATSGVAVKAGNISAADVLQILNAFGSLGEISVDLSDVDPGTEVIKNQYHTTTAAAEVMLEAVEVRGPEHLDTIAKQLAWEPDFYLFSEIEGWKIPKKFMPESMARPVRKLAMLWAEMCRFVMMLLNCPKEFGVGFLFDDGSTSASDSVAGAECRSEGDEHWLLVNPFTEPKTREGVLGIAASEEINWLFAMAVHECTHLAYGVSRHDEDFASAVTRAFALTAGRTKEIAAIKKAVLEHEREINARLESMASSTPASPRSPRGPKTNIIQYPGWSEIERILFETRQPWRPPSHAGRSGINRMAFGDRFVVSQSGRLWCGWEREAILPSGRGKSRSFAVFATGDPRDAYVDLFYVSLHEHPLPESYADTDPLWGKAASNAFQWADKIRDMTHDAGLYQRLVNETRGVERVMVPRDYEAEKFLDRESSFRDLGHLFVLAILDNYPDLELEAKAAGQTLPEVLDVYDEVKPDPDPSREISITYTFPPENRYAGRFWKRPDEDRMLFDLYILDRQEVRTFDTWQIFRGRSEVRRLHEELSQLIAEINSDGEVVADRSFLRLGTVTDVGIRALAKEWSDSLLP
jgi:hypothetical protein